MDAPLYENLPGFVTSLHSIEAPDLPDQKIRFPDGSEMDIAAGATACELMFCPNRMRWHADLRQSTLVRKVSSCSQLKSKTLP